MFLAQAPRSTFPRTAVTGAISPSLFRISGSPMSPAWMMESTPRSAAIASGRSSPCVSAMTPTLIALTDASQLGKAGRIRDPASYARPDGRGRLSPRGRLQGRALLRDQLLDLLHELRHPHIFRFFLAAGADVDSARFGFFVADH